MSVGAPTEVARSPSEVLPAELDEGGIDDAVATHQRDVQTGGLGLLAERAGLRVLTAVVDGLRVGTLDLA